MTLSKKNKVVLILVPVFWAILFFIFFSFVLFVNIQSDCTNNARNYASKGQDGLLRPDPAKYNNYIQTDTSFCRFFYKGTATPINSRVLDGQNPATQETAITKTSSTDNNLVQKEDDSTTTSLTIGTPDWAKIAYKLNDSSRYISTDELFNLCQNKDKRLFANMKRQETTYYTSTVFGDIKIKMPYRDQEYGENIYPAPYQFITNKTDISEYQFLQVNNIIDAVAFGEWLFIAEGTGPDTCVAPMYESQMVRYQKNDTNTLESVLPKDPYGQTYVEVINGITAHISLHAGLYEYTYIAFEHQNHIYVLKTDLESAKQSTVTRSKEIISQLELL